MPKLITKHDVSVPATQDKVSRLLYVSVSVGLLAVALMAVIAWSYLPTEERSSSIATTTQLTTALPADYSREAARLAGLEAVFDKDEQQNIENPEKHQEFMSKIDNILQQLNSMDSVVGELSLPDKDKQTLLSVHQYQKDYWESKKAFHRMRLARLQGPTPLSAPSQEATSAPKPAPEESGAVKQIASTNESTPIATELSTAVASAADKTAPATDTEATPKDAQAIPPDVKLPPDFCPLFGPQARSCKVSDHEEKKL